nr:hypothetical protein HEP87_51590 [Streptomyces sp. S1D4-11]
MTYAFARAVRTAPWQVGTRGARASTASPMHRQAVVTSMSNPAASWV